MNKKIETLGQTNKKFLREHFGYKNVRASYKDFGVDNAEDAYEAMRFNYNFILDQQEKKKKEINKKTAEMVKKNVEVFESTSVVELVMTLKKYKGKQIIVDAINNGNVIRSFTIDIPDAFNSWWNKQGQYLFIYPENLFEEYPNIKLYIYEPNNNITTKKILQVFKDADNGLCVFNPIRNWATEKYNEAVEKKNKDSKCRYKKVLDSLTELENEYKFGVDENNITNVCNKLQVDITIEKPFCDNSFITCKSIKKALKHFRYMNTRINHIELNEYVINELPTIVTREELFELKNNLVKNNIYHTFTKDYNGINKINTLDKVYSISNDMQECFTNFEIETGLINCKIDDIDNKELSCFIKYGTHYNGTIDFKNVKDYDIEKVFHLDMKKAYAQYETCDFYEGFLGKITDFRLTNKIEGVGLYMIDNLVIEDENLKMLNDTMKIYFSKNIYTSAELRFLERYNCKFDIIAGCWGVKPLDFEFNEDMLNKKTEEGNSYYALFTGKCDSHYLTKNVWIDGDEDFANIIKEHTSGKVLKYENNQICIKYDKKHNYHLGHFTAFITAYQRLNMLDQLLSMDYDNIIRVCVDGIYAEKECLCFGSFRPKNDIEDKTFENVAGETFISNLITDEVVDFDCGKYRKHNNKELHIGAGGNGKTHKNLTDNGLINLLYVSPSWKLARNKENEYKCRVSVWARLITEDPEAITLIKRFSNVLLIDECSMMSENEKLKIFEIYDDMKIIFCGDLGFQLSSFTGIEMNKEGFDEIIENNTNYRCKDNRLLTLLNDIREMISMEAPCEIINNFVINKLKNRTITKDKLKQMYNVNDMILVGTNVLKDNYTEMFKTIEKYYCKENNRLYCNGDIVIGEKPNCKAELRHAYTTHSIQGETAHYNLYIDSSKMFEPRMFYTALSRAKTLDQIFIIENL